MSAAFNSGEGVLFFAGSLASALVAVLVAIVQKTICGIKKGFNMNLTTPRTCAVVRPRNYTAKAGSDAPHKLDAE